jgi:hypothetical protein
VALTGIQVAEERPLAGRLTCVLYVAEVQGARIAASAAARSTPTP